MCQKTRTAVHVCIPQQNMTEKWHPLLSQMMMDQPSQVPQSRELSPVGTTVLYLGQKEKSGELINVLELQQRESKFHKLGKERKINRSV